MKTQERNHKIGVACAVYALVLIISCALFSGSVAAVVCVLAAVGLGVYIAKLPKATDDDVIGGDDD